MTVYDNPILMLLAFVTLAVAFLAVLKHIKVISVLALVLAGGGIAIGGGLYAIGVVV
jgi:hypothetical protein